MNIFGEHWTGHFERISEDWRGKVGEEDVVLIPGDISWAMKLQDAQVDLDAIAALPGKKVIIRGNHDYWWSAISRVRSALKAGMYAVQNDCVQLGGVLVAGSRGWVLPDEAQEKDDLAIYERELLRMEMSLNDARKRSAQAPLVAMIHFPPVSAKTPESGFSKLFEKYDVSHVVYGHLHGQALRSAFSGEKNGVMYHQVSCDGCAFQMHRVM